MKLSRKQQEVLTQQAAIAALQGLITKSPFLLTNEHGHDVVDAQRENVVTGAVLYAKALVNELVGNA